MAATATACVAWVALLIACAPSLEFRPYRACDVSFTSGRELLRTGTVIGKGIDDEGTYYLFQADDLPPDGRHILTVRSVRYPCAAAQPWGAFDATRR